MTGRNNSYDQEDAMKAGASTRILRFPEGFFPTEGFSRQLDPLCARVLVLENGARYALLVLELTSIPPEARPRTAPKPCSSSGSRSRTCSSVT